jgi:2-aminobenzoate-CoA ligase
MSFPAFFLLSGPPCPEHPMTVTAHVDTFARDHLPPRALWPELLFDLPELQYPERLNCTSELLDRALPEHGARPAIFWRGGAWTYAELANKVDRIARVLIEDLKLVPGNRVLLRGANGPMFAASVLAVWKAGCIAVPTMPLLRAPELKVIIEKARVDAALCAEPLKQALDEASAGGLLKQVLYFNSAAADGLEQRMLGKDGAFEAVDTAADDICLIAFTSGTTGKPKGTMHFHRDVLAICDTFPRSTLRAQANDIFIGTPPLAFTFGLGGLLLFPLRAGAATVLLEKATPESLLQAIQDFRASICFTAPTFYRQMVPLAGRLDLASL